MRPTRTEASPTESPWPSLALAALLPAALVAAVLLADPSTHVIAMLLVMVGTAVSVSRPHRCVPITVATAVAVLVAGLATGAAFRETEGSWALWMLTACAVVWSAGTLRLRLDASAADRERLRAELEAERHRIRVDSALLHMADRDPVERELQRAARYGRSAAVLALEIDNAELLADRLGAAAVRDALADLAELLDGDLRSPDIGLGEGEARLLCVLPETGVAGGRTAAERVRRGFAELRLRGADGIALTARAGIAAYPQDGSTPDQVLDAARAALAEARQRGGNCMVDTTTAGASDESSRNWASGPVADVPVDHGLGTDLSGPDSTTASGSRRVIARLRSHVTARNPYTRSTTDR